MDKETRKNIEEGFKIDSAEYVNLSPIDEIEKKVKVLDILSKELKVFRDEDSLRLSDDLKKERLNLEIKKEEAKKKTEEERLNFDKEKFKHQTTSDSKRISLEKAKTNLEKEKFEHQATSDNKRISIEKAKTNLEKEKANLEKEKFEHQKNLELQKIEVERMKIDLEYARLEVEKEVKQSDIKKDKRSFISNIAMKSLELLVPLTINTILVMMNYRLIYKDDGRIPSDMKDLMKHIYRK